jgi:phospholipid/cholesterol/gamma-HCH transport system substrate-binding protein
VRGRGVSKNRNAVAGLIGFAIVCLITFFGFTKDNPLDNPFQVKAAFKEVTQLKPNSPVRVAGVNVGKVKKVEGGPNASAIVTMEIKEAGLPLHRDAKAKVRPRIFLEGNFFVDIQPGTPSAPKLKDGGIIPVNNTAAPVQFGQVLEALQRDTREDLRTVLQEYGKAVSGEGGRGFNRSLQYWKPAFQNSAMVNDATRGMLEHDLSNYLAGARRVAEGLDRDPERLKSLITNLAATAGAFADEQDNLSSALDELPTTLRNGRRAFGALRTAFPAVRRLAPELEQTARSSGPALDATYPFVREMRGLVSRPELQGLVRDLRPTVPHLVQLNRGGVNLQEQTRALGSCNNNVLHDWNESSIPDDAFKPAGKIYQEASKQFVGLGAESRNFDANGQYVRSAASNANYAYLLGDNRFFLTSERLQGVNPPKKQGGPPPYMPDEPCENQALPDLRSNPAQPPQEVRIDHNAPGAAERRAKANARLMEWMQNSMKQTGMDKRFKLSDEPLKAAELDDVRRTIEEARR